MTMLLASGLMAQQGTSRRFTELSHLDSDTVKLSSTGETVSFLGTWIAPELNTMERVSAGEDSYIRTVDGQPVRFYPEKMTLRITVGSKDNLNNLQPVAFETRVSGEELARNLHFQLRVYRGLEFRIVEPVSARMIGVPSNIPYNERIYLVEFLLKGVPVEDRIVIEALDPQGNRVTRFSVALL